MGKEEIARNEQFLLFPQCFLLNQIIVSPFVHIFDILSLFAAEFKEPKIGISGKGLTWRSKESVDKCTAFRDKTKVMLKTLLSTEENDLALFNTMTTFDAPEKSHFKSSLSAGKHSGKSRKCC